MGADTLLRGRRPSASGASLLLGVRVRVVLVNNYMHLTGGADQHVFGLAEGLRERGHEVQFVATDSEDKVDDRGVFVPALVTHATRDGLGLLEQLRVARAALWNAGAARAMESLIASFHPDVVHAHKLYVQLSVAPVVVAARHGVPVVQTLHDFEMLGASPIDVRGGWWDRDEDRVRYKLLNSATVPVHRHVHAPRVSEFVAVSRFVQRVHAAKGIESTVLPNFVEIRDAVSIPGFSEREGVLFLARLQPEKGVRDAVELARLLPGISVTIAGTGDLQEWVTEQQQLLPNLHYAGFVPEEALRPLIAHARVVIVPSRCQDAGPLVPLEAMSEGTPVVAYANGGLAEYVVDARGGRVTPVDPVALAAVVDEITSDEAGWSILSRNARSAVAERHTRDLYIDRLEAVYARATEGRP